MMDEAKERELSALCAMPGQLTVAGRVFVVTPPSATDFMREAIQMKQLARAVCESPLEFVSRHAASLPPGVFALAIAEAVKLGAGGGVEPSEEAIRERYTLCDGVRWRLWYHVARVEKSFTPDAAAELVTEHNCVDVARALDQALGLAKIDPQKKTPPTGSPSS